MNKTYEVNGITCSGCVETIRQVIEDTPGVELVALGGDPPLVTLNIPGEVIPEKLHTRLKTAGNYKIIDAHPNQPPPPDARTYFPLILILVFLLLVTGLAQWGLDSFNLPLAMRHFMGGFFLIFSFFKLLDLRGFADSYSKYDLLASKVKVYAFVYPLLELILGIYFLSPLNYDFVLWFTLGLMSLSSAGVIRSLYRKQQIRCACLGTYFNLPMSSVTLVEDILMMVMAAAMLAMY